MIGLKITNRYVDINIKLNEGKNVVFSENVYLTAIECDIRSIVINVVK